MEKRNIEITLEKAKEWYKQGGDLKEVALQAFNEDELKDNFPTSWDEYNIKAGWVMDRIKAGSLPGSANYCYFNTKEEAEAFVALGKLIQLRDEYWRLDGNWKPDWTDDIIQKKFSIYIDFSGVKKAIYYHTNQTFVFSTPELRDKFYNNFKDLIEEAKMFL